MWATATGPGIFRSLGFKNPSGYWLLRRSTYSHTGTGGAGSAWALACVVCVCAGVYAKRGLVEKWPAQR